jgi:hypothetical protein
MSHEVKNDLLPEMTPRPQKGVAKPLAPSVPVEVPEPQPEPRAVPMCPWCGGNTPEEDWSGLCDKCVENSIEFVNACVAAKSAEDVQQAFATWSSRRGTEGEAALTSCAKCNKLIWNETWPQPDEVYCPACSFEAPKEDS